MTYLNKQIENLLTEINLPGAQLPGGLGIAIGAINDISSILGWELYEKYQASATCKLKLKLLEERKKDIEYLILELKKQC